jgi:hypothetical protein
MFIHSPSRGAIHPGKVGHADYHSEIKRNSVVIDLFIKTSGFRGTIRLGTKIRKNSDLRNFSLTA